MSSHLEGVKELTGKLTELGAKFAAKELRGTVEGALEQAEHKARARMPQGTVPHVTRRGRLVSPGFALSTLHIETRIDKTRGAAVALLGVAREAFYVLQFVELGWSGAAAQPWLQPAFAESEDAMLQTLAAELRERVERVARKRGPRG